jgi:hypothetical protein
MKVLFIVILSIGCFANSMPNCVITTCNVFNTSEGCCYRNRTSGSQPYVDFYGASIGGVFHYCPYSTMYCNQFTAPINNAAYCNSLLATGQLCFSRLQCQSGLCVLGKCASIAGSDNIQCVINSDCEYGLSCIGGKCNKPKQLGASCSFATPYGSYDMGMDQNECDYTKKLICGFTYTYGTFSNTTTCMQLFTITSNNIYVSNPMLCLTMVTDSSTENGFAPGYCISNRAQYLLTLTYDTGANYKTCSSNSDCVYTLNGTSTYQTPSNPCNCAQFSASPQSYCLYGGGEADVIADVAFYEKYWIPNYDMIFNVHAFKYTYVLDPYYRTTFIKPAYCSIAAFYNNVTVVPPTNASVLIFYIIVASLFAIGFVGLIVVFFMC